MASGQTLLTFGPQGNVAPAANYATLDLRNGHLCLSFDAATDESAVFAGVLPRHYAGGGITASLIWAGATATSGNVRWDLAFERNEDEGTDTDADSFASAQSATAAAPATSGALQYTAIAFSNAQIDSLAAGERFRLKLTRDADNGADTMTGFAQVFSLELRET